MRHSVTLALCPPTLTPSARHSVNLALSSFVTLAHFDSVTSLLRHPVIVALGHPVIVLVRRSIYVLLLGVHTETQRNTTVVQLFLRKGQPPPQLASQCVGLVGLYLSS